MKPFRFKKICCLLLLSLCGLSVSAQKLSADEQKIVDYIDNHGPEAAAMLERVVNIESPTELLAGVRNVGTLFGKEFEALGMTFKWIELPPEMKRAGHLLAQTAGTKGKRVLLLGHLDTVLSGEKYRREGERVYGTGIGDMKGGDVIVLEALRALNAAGMLKDSNITVMFTGDEENSGDPIEVSRADMVAAAKRSDYALSFEGTVDNTATVGRRGSSGWTLTVDAKTGHSGQIFKDSMGYGAIFEASRILNDFRTTLGGEKYLTFNPSMIAGGTTVETSGPVGTASGKGNVVPAKVVVHGDLRFIGEEQKASARERMREIVSKNLKGTKASITFSDGLPAMSPNAGNYELLAKLDQASRDLGFGKVEAIDPGERGAGDIAYIANILPCLDGIGMGGGRNSHAKGEYAQIDTMPMLTKRAAILIYRLTR